MKKLKTNDDLIKELLTPEEQAEVYAYVGEEVAKYWGSARKGAGRKPKSDSNDLKIQVELVLKKKSF